MSHIRTEIANNQEGIKVEVRGGDWSTSGYSLHRAGVDGIYRAHVLPTQRDQLWNQPEVDIVYFRMYDGKVFSGSIPRDLPTHRIMKTHLERFQQENEGAKTQFIHGKQDPIRRILTFVAARS